MRSEPNHAADLKKIQQKASNLLFPPACCFCHKIDPVDRFPNICRRCLSSLPLRLGADRQLDLPEHKYQRSSNRYTIYCAAYYDQPIRDGLIRMKFGDASAMARAFAGLLRSVVYSITSPVDAFAAVPLHKTRLAERGYNQSALLTRLLSDWLDIPDLSDGLQRIRATNRQSEMKDRSARMANPQSAFALERSVWQRWLNHNHKDPKTCHIILVDDVLTTGATLNAAAQPLLLAGFQLSGLVVASNAQGQQAASP